MLNTYGILQQVIFRPLGGVVMAHFGDLVGRKIVFAFYLLMALPTLFIGILPTFENIGYLAPLLLLLMRVVQGIAIGVKFQLHGPLYLNTCLKEKSD